MSFTAAEVDYLASQPLARFSTVDADGQPDVVPTAYLFDGNDFWIGGSGGSFLTTKKIRNITAGRRKAALVVDDMVSFDPFIARGIRVYGTAADPVEQVGFLGPGWYVQVTPSISWSWNMDGAPAGDSWYESRRQHHTRTRIEP
jgi:pyridoxamine 5'-phosphate oxidase family protein